MELELVVECSSELVCGRMTLPMEPQIHSPFSANHSTHNHRMWTMLSEAFKSWCDALAAEIPALAVRVGCGVVNHLL